MPLGDKRSSLLLLLRLQPWRADRLGQRPKAAGDQFAVSVSHSTCGSAVGQQSWLRCDWMSSGQDAWNHWNHCEALRVRASKEGHG
jgi:hypothetical protein